MLAAPDPTFRLLLTALRLPDSDAARAALASLATDAVDWQRFVGLARRHRVAPLAFRALSDADLKFPDELARQVDQVRQSAVFAEMAMASELMRLQQLLAGAGVVPMHLKGPALSLRAFGELGLRTYRDLDILVSEDSIEAVREIALASGYELFEPRGDAAGSRFEDWRRDHKDALFRHPDSGVVLEVHWRLFDNRSIMPIADLPPAITLGLPPLETARVLPLDSEVEYLCLHGAQHGWSRLRWLADVSALIPSASEQWLVDHARAQPAIAQALILCRELLGATFAPAVDAVLAQSRRGRWLARLAWSEILRSGVEELEAVPFGSTVKNLSHYAMLPNAAGFLEELRFDVTARPRLDAEFGQERGRVGGWMVRHLRHRPTKPAKL